MNNLPQNSRITDEICHSRAVRINLAKSSHAWFFHLYFSNYIEYETAQFQKEIFALTEDQNLPLVGIMAFRDSGKSSIVTTSLPIWSAVGKLNKKYILILSKTLPQARQHLANVRMALESNQLLANDFGPFQAAETQWTASSLILPKYQTKIACASLESSIRGLRFVEHRPDLVILDDIEDGLSTVSKELRDKTYNWFVREVMPMKGVNSKVVIVGNLLHPDSLMMRLKEEMDEKNRAGVIVKFPVLNENNEILWPAKFPSMKKIEDLKAEIVDEKTWNQEYLLNPLYDDNYVIKPEYIHYYDSIHENPKDLRYIAMGVDPAVTDNKSSCYTAIVVAKVFGNWDKLRIYILPDPILTKKEFPVIVETLKQLYNNLRKEGLVRMFVEGVAAQRYISQQLNHKDIPAEEVGVRGNKELRLRVLSHSLQTGRILFPKTGAEKLITQLVEFNNMKDKDLADAFSLMGNKIIENDKKIVVPQAFTVGTYRPLLRGRGLSD